MIIGIDGNEANVANRVGINVYGFELLRSMHRLQEEWENDVELIVYLKNTPVFDMPKETQKFKYKVIRGGGNWIMQKLIPDLFLSSPRPDIFFSPSHYVPLLSPIPVVCSIMDLGYLEFSGQFRKKDFWQLRLWSASSIYISKAIIAISNSTKSDIVRHYPSSKNKIYTTPLGYDKSRFNKQISSNDVRRVKKKYSIVDDYVLYIGTLKPSKNIKTVVEAIGQIKDVKLVVAGKKGWLFQDIYDKVKELSLEKRVIFTDFVTEEDKPALIKGAKLLVLASFWEGFGLDVLNAMACGVPVVVSDRGSLPEVVGGAGILVDPTDTNSIREGIEKVLFMSSESYNDLSERVVSRANTFSWDDTAKKTLEVLKKYAKR